MPCVCVTMPCKKNEVYFTLVVQCSTFLFEDTFLHDFVATSFFEALNHHSKTTNQIQEKYHFDMEYMPRQTKNLTISSFGKFHVKTPIHILKQLQRKFGHDEYNELHISKKKFL